jgi:hypothetical protein
MNKDLKIYLILIIAVLGIIGGILAIKNYNSDKLTEESAKCIAAKSVIYSQIGCSHCLEQKKLLGNFTSLFNIIECDNSPEKCSEAEIIRTPTWVINRGKYEGLQTIKKLKELTGC